MLKALAVLAFVVPLIVSCSSKTAQDIEKNCVTPEKLLELMKYQRAIVVDTMSYLECMDHRISGSICIALEEFEEKSLSLLKDKNQPVIFYCESEECPRAGQTSEKAKKLGYKNIYILDGGLSAWKKAGQDVESAIRIKRAPVISIKPSALKKYEQEKKNLFILDIRSEDAFKAGHISGAVNIPFYMLHKRLEDIPKDRPVIVVDENGKRSFLASCWLVNKGVKDVVRLFGGMKHAEGVQKGKG